MERVIVSNHNPDKDVAEWVWSDDPRVTLINQPGRRGCGYGWIVASQADADYFIVADDDLLLFPQQFATLFERLLAAPERPHGLAGVAGGRYYQRREMEADNLFQIYAITRAHLARYLELVNAIGGRGDGLAEAIEFWADDILISRSGLKKSAIHDAGPILRCDTASAPGVATFQAATFAEQRVRVRQALDQQGAIPNAGSGGDIPLANQA